MSIKYIIVFLFISSSIYSQEISTMSSNKYDDLLYGKVYSVTTNNTKGHPFLIENKLFNATLTYNGLSYYNVYLKYDIYNQKLVLFQNLHPQLPVYIELSEFFVDSFTLMQENNSLKFINSKFLNDLPQKIAYYQLAYDGNIKYFIGRSKEIQKLGEDKKFDKFRQNTSHYIVINEVIERIKTKKQIYSLLGDQKKIIKSYIRKNRLNVKLYNTESVVEVLKYFDKLNYNKLITSE